MDYIITYEYKGSVHSVFVTDSQNILGAIGQFIEDHEKECRITEIKER